jgi:heat shock protein HslJ
MAAAGFRIAALALFCAGCTSIAADQRTFDGTTWRVTAIDGRATPHSGDYSMRFTGRELGARFGCNHVGGLYSVAGETLRATEVRSTLMGCPEPAATFEREGLAVLGSPMRMSWSSGSRLTLSNSAGSIALVPAKGTRPASP